MYLYVLECNDCLKIGITSGSVYDRIATLQVGNPYDINVIYIERRLDAGTLEQYLHTHFANKRTRGEWFQNLPLTEIKKAIIEVDDSFGLLTRNKASQLSTSSAVESKTSKLDNYGSISINDAVSVIYGIASDKVTRADQMKASSVLKSAGFKRKKVRKVGQKPVWLYERPFN